jgi:hypothetical protein
MPDAIVVARVVRRAEHLAEREADAGDPWLNRPVFSFGSRASRSSAPALASARYSAFPVVLCNSSRNNTTPGAPLYKAALTDLGSAGSAGHVAPEPVLMAELRTHLAASTAALR